MSSLPSVRRFYNEDYSGSPTWFQRFIGTLNLFSDPVYQNLKNGLSFQQNFNAQVYQFTITAGATADLNTIKFTKTIAGQPIGLIIIACNLASSITAPVTSATSLSWYTNGNTIQITAINGLTSGTQYNISVLLF